MIVVFDCIKLFSLYIVLLLNIKYFNFLPSLFTIASKLADRSRGQPEGSLFNIYFCFKAVVSEWMNEWWNRNTFLYEDISLFFITQKAEISCKTETEAKDSDPDWGRTAILTHFSTHIVNPYSGPLLLWREVLFRLLADCLLLTATDCMTATDRPFSSGVPRDRLSSFSPAALQTSWLPKSFLTDCSTSGYQCIYYFITPMRSFWFGIHVICFQQSTYVNCQLVYTAGISCLEIPTWRVC